MAIFKHKIFLRKNGAIEIPNETYIFQDACVHNVHSTCISYTVTHFKSVTPKEDKILA